MSGWIKFTHLKIFCLNKNPGESLVVMKLTALHFRLLTLVDVLERCFTRSYNRIIKQIEPLSDLSATDVYVLTLLSVDLNCSLYLPGFFLHLLDSDWFYFFFLSPVATPDSVSIFQASLGTSYILSTAGSSAPDNPLRALRTVFTSSYRWSCHCYSMFS